VRLVLAVLDKSFPIAIVMLAGVPVGPMTHLLAILKPKFKWVRGRARPRDQQTCRWASLDARSNPKYAKKHTDRAKNQSDRAKNQIDRAKNQIDRAKGANPRHLVTNISLKASISLPVTIVLMLRYSETASGAWNVILLQDCCWRFD